MFVNVTLFNSEVWHNVIAGDISRVEKVDVYFLCKILGSHIKCPTEMLYLETGVLSLRFIIAGRRISYLHTLLKRDNTELTKQILMAHSNNPCKGDFIELVQADAQQIGVSCNFEDLVKLSKNVLKRTVKEKVREAAFKYLLEIKSTHSKVAHINYKNLAA